MIKNSDRFMKKPYFCFDEVLCDLISFIKDGRYASLPKPKIVARRRDPEGPNGYSATHTGWSKVCFQRAHLCCAFTAFPWSLTAFLVCCQPHTLAIMLGRLEGIVRVMASDTTLDAPASLTHMDVSWYEKFMALPDPGGAQRTTPREVAVEVGDNNPAEQEEQEELASERFGQEQDHEENEDDGAISIEQAECELCDRGCG